jgi:hypothetical protein
VREIGIEPAGRGGRRPREEPRPPVREPGEDPWERWREAYPAVFEVWQTSGDERVCPVCGPLAGHENEAGTGPMPPLHGNCRCQRVTSRVEWRLR